MQEISVIGTGYLGAVHATALAWSGFQVVGIDSDAEKVSRLNAGQPPFHEPGFDRILGEAITSGRLRFSTDYAAAQACDVHFLCVGTPQSAVGNAADLSYVWAAVEALERVVRRDSVLVGKSTVPVGTAAAIQSALGGDGPQSPLVMWNPEFLREGFAVQDTLSPDRIVVGRPCVSDSDREAAASDKLRAIYAKQIEEGIPYIETDLATAELVKVAANAFLATKISFVNAMAQVCDAVGADVLDLADAIGHDSRIGRRFLNAGVGFGGGCLPKDIRAFRARVDELGLGSTSDFLSWADETNMRSRQCVVDRAVDICGGTVSGAKITILGAAFKPDSDDVRDSPGLWIGSELAARGATVVVHDPVAQSGARRSHPHLEYPETVHEALADASLVVLATEWGHYLEMEPDRVAALVRRPVIIDGRNALSAQAWIDSGWHYIGVGRYPATRKDSVLDLRASSATPVIAPSST